MVFGTGRGAGTEGSLALRKCDSLMPTIDAFREVIVLETQLNGFGATALLSLKAGMNFQPNGEKIGSADFNFSVGSADLLFRLNQ